MSMRIILFVIKAIVNEEFVLIGQTVNSAYYCDVLRRLRENVRRLRPELWRQKNWLLHHDNMTSVPHPPYFSLFPRLNIKLKGHHFDTIQVIEAE
jgi:hypothetical protein